MCTITNLLMGHPFNTWEKVGLNMRYYASKNDNYYILIGASFYLLGLVNFNEVDIYNPYNLPF